MEASTDTLLTIIVTILSIIVVIALAVVIFIAFSVKKLLKKVHHVADISNESMSLLREQLIKKAGIISVAKHLMRKR